MIETDPKKELRARMFTSLDRWKYYSNEFYQNDCHEGMVLMDKEDYLLQELRSIWKTLYGKLPKGLGGKR